MRTKTDDGPKIARPGSKSLILLSRQILLVSADRIQNQVLRDGTLKVIDDPRFIACPAAKENHQAYPGGLLVHTAQVVEASTRLASLRHLQVDLDVLIAAGIWHDYGKVHEYQVSPVPPHTIMPAGSVPARESPVQIDYTPHRHLIRHLPRSYAMFMVEFDRGLKQELLDAIGHCILAHHGRKEWGSPVEPQTTEAHILHYADMLSAMCAKDDYLVDPDLVSGTSS